MDTMPHTLCRMLLYGQTDLHLTVMKPRQFVAELQSRGVYRVAAIGHYRAALGQRDVAVGYIDRAAAMAPENLYVFYMSSTALVSVLVWSADSSAATDRDGAQVDQISISNDYKEKGSTIARRPLC